MSDRYIFIRNWEVFQHKDVWRKSGGTPPWIKDWTKQLHDDDYRALSLAQRGILHGLRLMYASAGRSTSEALAKRLLCTNKAESRHWRSNLEALNHAGLIAFESRQSRAPVAPRVEKNREELSKDVSSENGKAESQEAKPGWIDNLNSYTGCRYARGTHAVSAIYDPLGTEPPPFNWPHPRPTRDEIQKALNAVA